MSNLIPPSTSPPQSPTIPEMTSTAIPDDTTAAATTSSLFEWSDFLDFNLDDPFTAISFDGDVDQQQSENPVVLPESNTVSEHADELTRIRKRDPRLVCSNFLAGRVPCSCPEVDEKMEQEEVIVLGGPGKKRARTVRAPAGSAARCQVPGCEADISELKGYHRRHRVCLRCANASAVVLDGQSKRYCQQCGKFHILSDFDEGKRSCRRKLERHNNRRRRKPTDAKGVVEQETQLTTLSDDISCDDETAKDNTFLGSQIMEKDITLESEGQVSTLCSGRGAQKVQSDSVRSFAAFDGTQTDGGKENPTYDRSPSYYDNKSSFSSTCPTGRISFKLYDWNPAEFPRRLRHQIFQWLASMPVELEGYIRPGCTIFTVFIAMPKFMWAKLHEDPALHLHNFVMSPGNMLSGRGIFFAYLNDMIYRVRQEARGTSVLRVMLKEQGPKLHYSHPIFFEAGKPMEFVVCGSNLLQPNLRLLVSFAGNYLLHDSSVSSSCSKTEEDANSSDHQLLKISIPQTQLDLFGPAFIEVENESGLSNFIPVLIGDKEICEEMKMLQQRFDSSVCPKVPEFAATSSSCQVSVSRQTKFSELITDIAWLLKRPVLEAMQPQASIHINRINNLLGFLIENESTAILNRILIYVETVIDKNLGADIVDADRKVLHANMDNARDLLCQNLWGKDYPIKNSRRFSLGGGSFCQRHRNEFQLVLSDINRGVEANERAILDARVGLTPQCSGSTTPLLRGEEVVMSVHLKERTGNSCSPVFTKTAFASRPLVLVITAVAVCLGVCAAIFHPQKVGELTTTIRRCLLEKS